MFRLAVPRIFSVGLSLLAVSLLATSCMTAYKRNMGGDVGQVVHRIYLTDFNTAWQAALDAMKALRLDVTNREGGFIQSKWTDNTVEKNFTESYGTAGSVLKAQYRFKVTVSRGFYNGAQSVRVSVQKDQALQHDILEGWRPSPSDTVEEQTLLYRIGRLITLKMKIAELEEKKIDIESQDVDF